MIRPKILLLLALYFLPAAVEAITNKDLDCPIRDDWKEGSEDCPCEIGWKLTKEQLGKMKFQEKFDPNTESVISYYRGVLCNANLKKANLRNANLNGLDLRGAILSSANLQSTSLKKANLQNANLSKANLQKANLYRANLRKAVLNSANLQEANLLDANLQGAQLYFSDVTDTKLARVNLNRSVFAPSSQPPDGYLEGLEGLRSVIFPPGSQSGLVQLRELLRQSGLRDLEREATFAIEHNKARHARCESNYSVDYLPYTNDPFKFLTRCGTETSVIQRLGGWLKLVLFEWTTGWGLYPGQALAIMVGLMVLLIFVYAIPLAGVPLLSSNRHAIYRIWPVERIDNTSGEPVLARDGRVERLIRRGPSLLLWAFYFSLVSAFHIGWREVNVGSWLSKVQPAEYSLRAIGWVRVVSGIQSLISVYLIAMWVLTYFGRPFE